MRKRLVVYGLLGMALAIVLSTQYTVDRPDAEMVVIVNPVNPLNPVVKNPYQTEYEQMLYPAVRITAGWSTGTGVIISVERGAYSVEGIAILTAAHVVGDENTVNIELYDAKVITGTVVITDTIKDIALIKAEINTDFNIYKARLAPENYKPYIFTPVWAVGCSLGLEPRPSFGHITSIDRGSSLAVPSGSLGLTNYWEISAPILPGNSGGPVFSAIGGSASGGDAYYQVIGIAVWVKTYQGQLVTTMAGIVPINQIYEFLDSHQGTKTTK